MPDHLLIASPFYFAEVPGIVCFNPDVLVVLEEPKIVFNHRFTFKKSPMTHSKIFYALSTKMGDLPEFTTGLCSKWIAG